MGIDSVKDYAVKYSVKELVKELDKAASMRHLYEHYDVKFAYVCIM